MRHFRILLCLISFFLLTSISYAQFTDISAGLTGVFSGSSAWGDYDNDGDMDILQNGNTGSARISIIYRNDGSGTFTDISAGLTGVSNSSCAWGDYNNDGYLDILLTGDSGSGYISKIYRNNGNNTFTDISAGLTGVYQSSCAWGDYDNDGDPDILLIGNTGSGYISKIYSNDGSGIFTDISAGLTGVYRSSCAWGDYDNDGDLDILLTGDTGSGYISKIYRNNGNSTFTDISAGLTGVNGGSSAWGDYDNDGDPDILLTGDSGSGYISKIYSNNGSGIFTDISAGLTNVRYGSCAWGDYDNDGDLDILLTGYAGAVYYSKIYNNNGGGIFTDISAGLTSVYMSSCAWGDYDNDGDLDILLTGYTGSGYISTIYSNDYNVANVSPLAPTNLQTTVDGDEVSFTWTASTDDHTPAAGLKYLLRIGTTPGGCEISSPMSNSGGWRMIPQTGYANSCSWKIKTSVLEGSAYYCSVQAVDTAFRGSAFAGELEEGTFTDISAGLTGVMDGSCAWGDYDNDGDLDILLTGLTGSVRISKIYRNDGNSTFTDISAGLTGVYGSSCTWGDYDNDGNLDLLLTGDSGSGYISKIYHNNGNSTFTDISAGLTGVYGSSCAWGDYDNDGDLDILLTGYTGSARISKIYRNDGNSTFTDINAGLTGVIGGSCAWGDYDNDGDLDIMLTGYTGSERISKIYRNNGNNTFTDISAGLIGVNQSSCAWGDYDNDGDLDILLTGNTGVGGISKIYRNDGSGIFTDISAGLTSVIEASSAWGDYDNDGDLDILLTGSTGPAIISKIYRNDGSGIFTDISAGLTGVYTSSSAWGDYDNDGDLDILLTGYSGSAYISKIYRNDYNIPNLPPLAPTNLQTTVNGDDVLLSWNASTDDHTPAGGLSYVLRIGTTPGGCEISSPSSDSSGWRMIPQPGYANSCSWKIKTSVWVESAYYWSVQAVDTAFLGSALSEQQALTNSYSQQTGSSHNFGNLYLGSESEPIDIILLNTGSFPISIDLIEFQQPGSPFVTSMLPPVTIPVGDSLAIPVTFIPQTEGTVDDSVFIHINSPNLPIIAVQLTGTGESADPLPPANVEITTQGESIAISWDPVTQTIYESPFTPDYYIVFYNGSIDPIDGLYYYLGCADSTSMVHDRVLLHADYMFYHVRAFRDYSARGIMSRTPDLNREMTEAEVLRLLKYRN